MSSVEAQLESIRASVDAMALLLKRERERERDTPPPTLAPVYAFEGRTAVSLADVAKGLSMSMRTVARMVKRRELLTVDSGNRRRLVAVSEIYRWVRDRQEQCPSSSRQRRRPPARLSAKDEADKAREMLRKRR